jgi:hypothetical protein
VTVLPLLESALTELWNRREHGTLTHDAYQRIGGIAGWLGNWCDQVADLLNLEVDLLFFDTASTCFPDRAGHEPTARDDRDRLRPGGQVSGPVRDIGFRSYGKSKDHRHDLPRS